MNIDGCLGCQVITGKIIPPGGTIYETAYWQVNHCVSPALLPGFLIIQPKRHCEHLAELTAAEAAELGTILQLTTSALSNVVAPEKIYLCSFGEKVKHIHFWILPRYAYISTAGFDGLSEIAINRKWICSDKEAAAIAEKVRAEFHKLLGS
jgi:diadenosine tetraphosphate (Ap4A) HIT family hydrolase